MQLKQSKYREFGCVCPVLMGYNVDDNNPNEWTEQILEEDEECVMHGKFGANGRSSEVESGTVRRGFWLDKR